MSEGSPSRWINQSSVRRTAAALCAGVILISCGLGGPHPVDTVADMQILSCKAASLSLGTPLTRFGPEDIVIDQRNGMAYVSVSNYFAHRTERAGYLLRLDLKQASPTPVDVTPDLLDDVDHKNFAPHGMSLLATEFGHHLFVINHRRQGGEEVLVLDIANDQNDLPIANIKVTDRITDEALTRPNAIAALDPDHVFVVNTNNGEGNLAPLFGFNRGKLVGFVRRIDGTWKASPGLGEFNHGSGIAATQDGKRLYVSEFGTGIIHGFKVQDDHTVAIPTEQRALGTGVDNIRTDPNGTGLLIAAHPSIYRVTLHGLGLLSTSPSEVIWLDLSGTATARAVRIFRRDGSVENDTTSDNISASSVAAIYRRTPADARVVIGSIFAGKVLVCDIPDDTLPPR